MLLPNRAHSGAAKTRSIAPIGRRIKDRRKELGLTLEQLARISGLSAPFISQAERDLTVPSLVSLNALANALEVELKYFMEFPQTEGIIKRGNQIRPIAIDSPVSYYDLASTLPNRKMDAILMEIPPGHVFPIDQRDGEDFLYMLDGELYATAGEVRTTLRAGDSMHFDSRAKHSAENRSGKNATLLYVGTPALFTTKPVKNR